MAEPTVTVGFLTVEDLLIKTLREGFEGIVNNLPVIDEIFVSLPLQERVELKDFLIKVNANKMNIKHGFFTREDMKLPAWYVTLANETEIEQFVGEEVDDEDYDETNINKWADYRGSLFESTYSIATYADVPTRTIALYTLAKFILLGQREKLTEAGLTEIRLTGSDFQPQQQFNPDLVYARLLTLSCKTFNVVNDIWRKVSDVTVTVNTDDTGGQLGGGDP